MLAYMRSLPNWAYNGGAKSMGDLGNNGGCYVVTMSWLTV
jgi:hypothetical protein